MKRIVLTVLVLMLIVPQRAGSQSADSGRLQAAEELARLMYTAESRSDIAGAVVDAKIQADPKLKPYRAALLDWARKTISWEELGRPMIDFYARQFSEAEIHDIIAFYRTPTGQKFVERAPAMMIELQGATIDLAKKWQKEIDQLLLAEMGKDGGTALREHANRLFDEEKWPEARDAYLKYLESHPDEVDVITDLGVCYRSIGDKQKALAEFDRALALKPDHWQSLYNKIIVLNFDLDRKAEAVELLAKLRAMQPDNPDVEKLAQSIEKR